MSSQSEQSKNLGKLRDTALIVIMNKEDKDKIRGEPLLFTKEKETEMAHKHVVHCVN